MPANTLKVGDVFKIRADGLLWEVVEDIGSAFWVKSEIGTNPAIGGTAFGSVKTF